MRSATIIMHNRPAGRLIEDEDGYRFTYLPEYLSASEAEPISLTLPLSDQHYHSTMLFPFFDGLIPEGWMLQIVEQHWKLNPRDRMGLLLACCRDCIGAVSVIPDQPMDAV
ncbi:MAG: HipA N-terminal domain-containing protein [Chlorobi bacterium]|nr:HipA N-terminal domain-containing protein [Chlorobiota bacterium]